MTATSPLPTDPTDSSGSERFNSVLPDLGSSADWDRSDLGVLLTLHRGPDGALWSPHAVVNVNGALFGGQLLGQALAAAREGLAPDALAHSLQVNFLNAGRPAEPMRYEVRPLMRGRSFSVQQVTGTQGDRVVITAVASFQRPEAGPTHQPAAPTDVGDPDRLPTLGEVLQRNAHQVPEAVRRRLGQSRMVDLRSAEMENFLFERDPAGRFRYWIRIKPALADDPGLHQAALAYLSDYWFALTAMAPHVDAKVRSGLYIASLNHMLWLHHAADANDWLLFDAVAPFVGGARGLTTGHVYRRDGTLVATLAQEGLFRGWVAEGDGYAVPGMPESRTGPARG